MKGLFVHNANYLTYTSTPLLFDVLGGVDTTSVERLMVTLRTSYKKQYQRSSLDLYSDTQRDKLLRKLCDTFELGLLDVAKHINSLVLALETYRLEQLQYTAKAKLHPFSPNQEDRKAALKTLKSNTLFQQLISKLQATGIIGEDDNALLLLLALASHKYEHPFSVLCMAKSGIGKSYLLQKLSDCMPQGSYSFHTQLSANALYYFNNNDLTNKALLIEDMEWTTAMLKPLTTLQSTGRLVKTRATKDKDGMLHSTTFEVKGKLCLVACAYSDRNYEGVSLPFLCIHLNHSSSQDLAVMDYQRRVASGLVAPALILQAQHELKCIIACLKPVKVINPYATLIELPPEVQHPRKSLLLLLNCIEVITYMHQYQRQRVAADQHTAEYIESTPADIAEAFRLLQNSLLRKADELSTTARGFYDWLQGFLTHAKTNRFHALDIRKARSIHPRTLNRYLQELRLYNYIQITGGNKHREGYQYKITALSQQKHTQQVISDALAANLERIHKAHRENNLTSEARPESDSKPKTAV